MKRYKKLRGNELPSLARKFLEADRAEWGGWVEAWYRGDIDTTEDWIIVTDNGGWYKVDAKYMTWFRNKDGKIGAKANWSKTALERTGVAIRNGKPIPFDPGYQT